MASNTLTKITAEAKRIRKNNPTMKWTDAVKKAGQFYRSSVKPAVKKAVKTTRKVYKATSTKCAPAIKKAFSGIGKVTKSDFTRVNSDVNGNPRYAIHFLSLVLPSEGGSVQQKYDIALKRARKIGGRKFSTKAYGGGIVFQSYNIESTAQDINNLMKDAEAGFSGTRSRSRKIGAPRSYEVDKYLVDDMFYSMQSYEPVMRSYENSFLPNVARKIKSGKLDKTKLPKLMDYLYKNNLPYIKKNYGDVKLNPAERQLLAQFWSDLIIEDIYDSYKDFEPVAKIMKGKKMSGVYGSTGRKKIGSAKVTTKTSISKAIKTNKPIYQGKPKKPTLTALKEANKKLFDAYYVTPYKEQKIFFSPYVGRYILIRKRDNKKISYYNNYKKGQLSFDQPPLYDVYEIVSDTNHLKYFDNFKHIDQVNLKFMTDIKD